MAKETKKEILVWYYLNGEKVLNLGEHFTEILVHEFGYKTRCYSDAESKNELGKYDSCLMIIGSELHKRKIDSLKVPKVLVWGQGKGRVGKGFDFDIHNPPYSDKVKIYAVRGSYTIRQLKLDPDTPRGDPGFLMPLFFPIKKEKSQHKIVYVPHFNCKPKNIEKELEIIGAEKYINVMISKDEFWKRLKEIVSAKFVLTSSLHTSIIAHAYGVPWALQLAEGKKLDKPEKWRDLFEFLGIYDEFKIVKNYDEGLKWWKGIHSKAKIPSLIPLIKSFPFPIKNKKILKIIKNEKV
ncbi:polysaccharide pyruvyl transferase family protein [Chloroflexota bacterium]